ncbi:MAG TPA: GWxTD domain-containing protein [Edaphobacter sp.]
MRLRYVRTSVFVFLMFLTLASSVLHAADPAKNLSPRFRHWINEEVPYIIETDERKQFLALANDAERENFIKAFWEVRNPNPGSEINEYREEHYRRLAYANQYFGNINAQDGWRTDRGRIYIMLGEPKQKANYPERRNVRPMMIWFYQATTPALPTHFNILFYKRSMGEDYTLYSPYQDGPSRLVTGLEGKNDDKNNLDVIKRSLGVEVARTAVSLIPTEPVSLDDYRPSLQSDVLLSTIKGLPDNPLTKEMLNQRRANERVTTSVFTGSNPAILQTAVFRDSSGRMTVHSLLSYERPEGDIIGVLSDKQTGYSLTLQTSVLTEDGRPVYVQNEKLAGVVNETQATAARNKRFGAESRVPLSPGKYQIISTLTNDLNHQAVRQHAEVVVPDPTQTGWTVSKVLVFSPQPPTHDPDGVLPFSVSGLRFVPKGVQQVSVHPGEPVRLLYQLWSKPSDPASREGHKVKVHYVYGTMQAGQTPHQEDEEIDAANFDASGTLLTGRTLSTEGLSPGNYRAVITATDETTQQKAYASLIFRVTSETDVTDMWTAYDASESGGRGNAIDDYKRGLSAVMQSQNDSAISWMQRSLADDPHYLPALTKLVDLLSESNKYKEIVELSTKFPLTHEVSQQTAIQMSQANEQAGDYPQATHILESELQFQPPNADLYLALADVYQRQGNLSKAEDYKRQAAKLAN